MSLALPLDTTEWTDPYRRRALLKPTGRFIRLFALCALTTTLILVACTFSEFVSFSRAPAFLDMLLFKEDLFPFHADADLTHYTPAIYEEDLRAKLQSLLTSPLRTYQDAYDENAQGCPREVTLPLVNPNRINRRGWFWERVRLRELVDRRMRIVKYLEDIESRAGRLRAIPGHGGGRGRGIVLTGGNEQSTARMLTMLRILRIEYGCRLPVEVFCFPGEISSKSIAKLRALNATVHELTGRRHFRFRKNFQIKADAIIASSFEEVLYLDSDNIPLRDPTYLFDTELYAGPGQPKVVFWPDINKDHPSNPVWRIMDRVCDGQEWEIETGQILISKTGNNGLNLVALRVAAHMQEDNDFWFQLSEGDKDTFRYAFWALRLEYSVSQRWLSSLGFHADWDEGRFCGIAMLQYDIAQDHLPAGSHPLPLFVHANLLKHRAHGYAYSPSLDGDTPFAIVKRLSDDVAASGSLEAARMWVYKHHGMCVDVGMRSERSMQGGMGAEKIVEERFEDAYDGAFRNFTTLYLKHGGLLG